MRLLVVYFIQVNMVLPFWRIGWGFHRKWREVCCLEEILLYINLFLISLMLKINLLYQDLLRRIMINNSYRKNNENYVNQNNSIWIILFLFSYRKVILTKYTWPYQELLQPNMRPGYWGSHWAANLLTSHFTWTGWTNEERPINSFAGQKTTVTLRKSGRKL